MRETKPKEFEPVRYMRTLGFNTREAEAWIEEWNQIRQYLLSHRKECINGKKEERA